MVLQKRYGMFDAASNCFFVRSIQRQDEGGGRREGSSSFLKKRTKKLLLLGMRTERSRRVNQVGKSFLVLFFKKELLASWPKSRRTDSSKPGAGACFNHPELRSTLFAFGRFAPITDARQGLISFRKQTSTKRRAFPRDEQLFVDSRAGLLRPPFGSKE